MTFTSLSSPLRKKEKIGFGVTLSSPLRTCSPLRGKRGFSPFSKIGSPLQGGIRTVEEEGVGGRGGGGHGQGDEPSTVWIRDIGERYREREREREERERETELLVDTYISPRSQRRGGEGGGGGDAGRRGRGGERDSPASSLSMSLSHDSGLLMWGGKGGGGGGERKTRGEERREK
jgi:hypothetical protein